MANDTQLKAAIVANYAIQKLVKKAFKQKTKYAMYKLQVKFYLFFNFNWPIEIHIHTNGKQQEKANENAKKYMNNKNEKTQSISNTSKVFNQFDIVETSIHLQAAVLNIHLYCDENYSGDLTNSKYSAANAESIVLCWRQ
jgi:hypothetical protein